MLTTHRGPSSPSARVRWIVALLVVILSAVDWLAYFLLHHAAGAPVGAILITVLAALFLARAWNPRLG